MIGLTIFFRKEFNIEYIFCDFSRIDSDIFGFYCFFCRVIWIFYEQMKTIFSRKRKINFWEFLIFCHNSLNGNILKNYLQFVEFLCFRIFDFKLGFMIGNEIFKSRQMCRRIFRNNIFQPHFSHSRSDFSANLTRIFIDYHRDFHISNERICRRKTDKMTFTIRLASFGSSPRKSDKTDTFHIKTSRNFSFFEIDRNIFEIIFLQNARRNWKIQVCVVACKLYDFIRILCMSAWHYKKTYHKNLSKKRDEKTKNFHIKEEKFFDK